LARQNCDVQGKQDTCPVAVSVSAAFEECSLPSAGAS